MGYKLINLVNVCRVWVKRDKMRAINEKYLDI